MLALGRAHYKSHMTERFWLALPSIVIDNPTVASMCLVATGVVFSFCFEWLTRGMEQGRYGWQQRLRARLGIEPGRGIPELKWLTLSYQFLLWPFIGFLLLHVWGLHDLGDRVSEVLAGGGIKMGSVTIVPSHLLMGVLWFVLLLTFSRWLKRKLEHDWLPLTQIEHSVRVSIATLFGYITFVLALLVGLTVVGIDLSKLAIVAGALSVGIGFGLQNIVNNFVSGLILLFERPVRLGDYIKVGGVEGFVRRIRIRSTELETWDRTSVIVPNSELLSSKVENTGYHDQTGRLVLPVGVDYKADPAQVKQILLKAAEGVEGVIQSDEVYGVAGPSVMFADFGDNALHFELRAYLRDINSRLSVASELRYRIFELLNQAEVGIPFPQRDLWVRNWPQQLAEGWPQAAAKESAAVERP